MGNVISFGFIYLGIIGVTIIFQSIANKLMRWIADFFENKKFPLKVTILTLIIIYIEFVVILVDIIFWSGILMTIGVFNNYLEAFIFATDAFSTLGNGGNLEPPWEFLAPVMAVNGIVMIAFGGACMYSILYGTC